jgi:hypothetical protein
MERYHIEDQEKEEIIDKKNGDNGMANDMNYATVASILRQPLILVSY